MQEHNNVATGGNGRIVAADAIPAELTALPQWCLWKVGDRDGQPTKMPHQLDGTHARSNDPKTWATFDAVLDRYSDPRSKWDGIGFVFSATDPFCGIDLDGCRNPTTGQIAEWAKTIIADFTTYSEISPSGTGVKLWVRGRWTFDGHKQILAEVPRVADKTPAIEVYDSLRYFAVTGQALNGHHEIADRQEQLDRLRAAHWPASAHSAPAQNLSPLPASIDRSKIIDRAAAYLAKVPPAIQGRGGSDAAIRAACELFRFGLTDGEARSVFDEFNSRCVPPWSDSEIKHKLESARSKVEADGEFGCRLNKTPSSSRAKKTNTSATSSAKQIGRVEVTFGILEKLQNVTRESPTQWRCDCPVGHDGNSQSLTVTYKPSCRAELSCSNGCKWDSIWQSSGALASDLMAKREVPQANESSDQRPNEAPDDPHRLARLFIEQRGTTFNGELTLRYWCEEWWLWDGFAYRVISAAELRADLAATIKQDFDRANLEELAKPRDKDQLPPRVRKVTTGLLTNVMLALSSLSILHGRTPQPSWLIDNDEPFPADEVFATTTGLIHIPSLVAGKPSTLPPTPQFFSAGAVDYGFDLNAECPQWLKFLESLWPDDPQSIKCLQEWFGYLLLPDTRQHKLLLLIGPPRSGKGAIGRILKRLIGERSFATPTLSSLASPFGLWPLSGKTVALIPDARLSGRADAIATTERLLSISGEDPQDIHRKCLPTITGVKLPIRFVLMTNELPNLQDSSGAFANRVVMLKMVRSWLGKEDKQLDARLQHELPAILNWSIEGWQRLQEHGRFEQPESAREMLSDLSDLTSPVSQFVRERCIIGPEWDTSIEDLFGAWLNWCAEHGRKKTGTQQTFGRDLHAKITTLSMSRPRIEGSRIRSYRGIGIREGSYWTQTGPQWSATQSYERTTSKNECDEE